MAAVTNINRRTVPIISFVGNSGSGKTTLIVEVVRDLKKLGYRVAVVKHSPHGFDIDHEGKDSWRFLEAGSNVVGVSSPSRMTFIEDVDKEPDLSELQGLLEGKADILLAEGYKASDTPKIVVVPRREDDGEGLTFRGETLAVVSPQISSPGIPEFSPAEVRRIVDLLVNLMVYEARPHNRFDQLLAECETLHGHICPGQVLGVRMALLGCRELGIEDPRNEPKRLVVYVEIDRCATDAIQVVTGCKLGKRTMKYMDYGKVAATLVDLRTGEAVRVVAREDAREKATLRQSEGCTRYEAQLSAYKEMPDDELFSMEHVQVKIPVEDMPGPPAARVICRRCGEAVNDRREVMVDGDVMCRACAYGSYYEPEPLVVGLVTR
ncbi:MAG: molybdopterin-guanine dinucleotide biosynthesis protein B [Chloroflexi bacterium]|nr:molybdopterin-guanine dinucleotide biosynthesis protein B [Chloroflexota bacterium]